MLFVLHFVVLSITSHDQCVVSGSEMGTFFIFKTFHVIYHHSTITQLSISITYESLKIKFLLKTRFRAVLLSYFRSVVLAERGLTNEKICWLKKSSLLILKILWKLIH